MSEKLRHSILHFAEIEIGTLEQPAGSNIVKYNDWYYPAFSPNGKTHPYFVNPKPYSWCGTFCSYIYFFAGFPMPTIDTNIGVHYVPTLQTMAKAKKWTTDTPLMGDLVLFDWEKDGVANHIGIFYEWIEKGISFSCIEGNTSSSEKGSQSNGDGVYKKKRFVSSVIQFVNLIDNVK